MPAEAEGDFVMNAVLIPDLEDLEKRAQEGEVRIPVSGQDGRTASGDEGTDSTGAGGIGGPLLGMEAGSDIASGGGKGSGMLGGLMGGISKIALGVTAIVGILAMLEPIQAVLSGIMRILEFAVVPLAMALSPLINAMMEMVTKLTQFLRDPVSGITSAIKSVVQSLGNAIIGGLNQIPGVNIKPLRLKGQEAPPGAGIQDTSGSTGREGVISKLQLLLEENPESMGMPPLAIGMAVAADHKGLSDEAFREQLQEQSSNSGEKMFSNDQATP